MIVPHTFEYHVTGALTEITNRYVDLYDIVLDDSVREAFLRHWRRIIEVVPASHRRYVRRFIEWLKGFNPERVYSDPDVQRVVFKAVCGEQPPPEEEAWRVLARHLPVYGQAGGRKVIVLDPHPPSGVVEDKVYVTIRHLAKRMLRVEPVEPYKKYRVVVGGFSREVSFSKLLEITGEHHTALQESMIKEMILSYLKGSRLERYLNPPDDPIYVHVGRSPTIYICFGSGVLSPYTSDFSGKEVLLSLVLDNESLTLSGSVQLRVEKRSVYGARVKIPVPVYELKPAQFVQALESAMKKLCEGYARWRQVFEKVVEEAEARGYRLSEHWPTSDGAQASFTKEVKTRSMKASVDVIIASKYYGKEEADIKVTLYTTRNIRSEFIELFLNRRMVGCRLIEARRRKFVLKHHIDSVASLSEPFRTADKILGLLSDLVQEYVASLREKEKLLSDEHYVALLLAREADRRLVDVQALTGKPYSTVYSAVRRILHDLVGDSHQIPVDEETMIIELVRHGYIDLSSDGELLVNGKPLTSLLRDLELPREVINNVREKVLKYWAMVNYPLEHTMTVKGIATPEAVKTLINAGVAVPFSILLHEWQGMPLVYCLDRGTRSRYVRSLSAYDIAWLAARNKIFREVFRENLPEIIQKLGEVLPHMITHVVYHMAPDIIGVQPEFATPVTDGGYVVGIDCGEVVVAVRQILQPHPESPKTFMVFDKRTRLGMIVEARSVSEAAHVALTALPRLMQDLEKLERLPGVRVVTVDYGDTGFRLAGVEVPGDIAEKAPAPPGAKIEKNCGCIVLYYPGLVEDLEQVLSGEEYSEEVQVA